MARSAGMQTSLGRFFLKTAFLGTIESEPPPLLGDETWQGI